MQQEAQARTALACAAVEIGMLCACRVISAWRRRMRWGKRGGTIGRMLRKIDCVMLRVPDLDAAVGYYGRVFGLGQLWRDEVSVGMGMPETDAEIVLHTLDLPPGQGVHCLVDDVPAAVEQCRSQGCVVRRESFAIAIGWCAVLEDPFGNAISILDTSTGLRT
ncbi:VOC family protein [Actinocatenispora sera]|uniref:VOC family protein n=1 Tax=Actinocatenispora sera TaxID=390989 RepID=UPI0033F0DCDB